MTDFPYFYTWRNNALREAWYGRRVRIVATGAKRTVLIEAAVNGERMTTSVLALRKIRRRGP